MRVLRADKSGETELSGTSNELLQLARAIRLNQAAFPLEKVPDASPYTRSLAMLESTLTSGSEAISMSSEGDTLEIRGGAAALALLAENIEGFAAEGDETAHLHIDYFPGHEYLSQNSNSLVIALNAAS